MEKNSVRLRPRLCGNELQVLVSRSKHSAWARVWLPLVPIPGLKLRNKGPLRHEISPMFESQRKEWAIQRNSWLWFILVLSLDFSKESKSAPTQNYMTCHYYHQSLGKIWIWRQTQRARSWMACKYEWQNQPFQQFFGWSPLLYC